MVSNLGRHVPRDFEKELAGAYDGEVPPPYYWQAPLTMPRHPARHHPGELEVALPYAAVPVEFTRARAVSIEELDEMVERRARREEIG